MNRRNNIVAYFFFISAATLILVSCFSTGSRPGIQPAFYSRNGHGIAEFDSLYLGIPVFQESALDSFVIFMNGPKYPVVARKQGFAGEVRCQVLVDENGEVEAVLVKRSVHPSCDQAAIAAIQASKFKTLKEVKGRKGKYFIMVWYKFILSWTRF